MHRLSEALDRIMRDPISGFTKEMATEGTSSRHATTIKITSVILKLPWKPSPIAANRSNGIKSRAPIDKNRYFAATVILKFSLTLGIGGSLNQWIRPADHLVQRRSGRDHWIHAVFFFNLELDQKRLAGVASAGDGG